MKIALLYPPFMDARAPQLALPSLAAFLRSQSITVVMRDLAIDGLLWMTERQTLDRSREWLSAHRDISRRARRLLDPFDRAIEMADWAVATLRHPVRFYDSRDFNGARDILACILEAHAAASDPRIRCSLDPVNYIVGNTHSGRFRELEALTRDPAANLFHEYYRERVLPALRIEAPDAVGITLTNHQQWVLGLFLSRLLKDAGFFVVLGGALISKFTESLGQLPEFFRTFADGVVTYEGETAALELATQLDGSRQFQRVPNFIFLDGSSVRATPTRVEDVNTLPTPDFDGLPLSDYLSPEPVLPILTGKGCYFNRCKFCEIPFINHISPKAYRVRRPELVVQDVRTLTSKHGARHFVITDEALSPKLLLNLAEAFAPFASEERHFTGYARLEDGFTAPVFETIAAMGVRKLFFGMESASQVMIDHMDKETDTAKTAGILTDCQAAGIRFHLFSIIGFPEETEAMARETYRFLLDHRAILDSPGNSFGVRRFSLDPRAEYFLARDRYGVRMSEDALDAEFLLGFSPEQWENTRGLSKPATDRLLNEFNSGLAETFRNLYGHRFTTSPAGEEYAVLYCGRYSRSEPFPFLASLPDTDSGLKFTIRVNPSVLRRDSGDLSILVTPLHRFTLGQAVLNRITGTAPTRVRDLFSTLPAGMLSGIDDCLREGVLQIRTTVEDSSETRA